MRKILKNIIISTRKKSGFKLKQKMIAAMMGKGYAYDKISEKLGGMNDG